MGVRCLLCKGCANSVMNNFDWCEGQMFRWGGDIIVLEWGDWSPWEWGEKVSPFPRHAGQPWRTMSNTYYEIYEMRADPEAVLKYFKSKHLRKFTIWSLCCIKSRNIIYVLLWKIEGNPILWHRRYSYNHVTFFHLLKLSRLVFPENYWKP